MFNRDIFVDKLVKLFTFMDNNKSLDFLNATLNGNNGEELKKYCLGIGQVKIKSLINHHKQKTKFQSWDCIKHPYFGDKSVESVRNGSNELFQKTKGDILVRTIDANKERFPGLDEALYDAALDRTEHGVENVQHHEKIMNIFARIKATDKNTVILKPLEKPPVSNPVQNSIILDREKEEMVLAKNTVVLDPLKKVFREKLHSLSINNDKHIELLGAMTDNDAEFLQFVSKNDLQQKGCPSAVAEGLKQKISKAT